jgi:hypothetical protein
LDQFVTTVRDLALEDFNEHVSNTTDVHGSASALSEVSPGTYKPRVVESDAAGQFEVGTPTIDAHAATKAYVDTAETVASDRANHTGTQTLSTISDAGTAAALDTGTGASQLPTNADRDGRANTFTETQTFSGGTAGVIQIKTDTAANWTAANPTLEAGEQGHETDTGRRKVGDGATAWNSLSYVDADLVANDHVAGLTATQTLSNKTLTSPTINGGTLDAPIITTGAYLGGTAAANLLDDYEEGTWTPVIEGGTTSGTYTITGGDFKYVKTGSVCHFKLTIPTITVDSAGSGDMLITGLPFTASPGDCVVSFQINNGLTWASDEAPRPIIAGGSNTVQLRTTDSSGATFSGIDVPSANLVNCFLRVSGSYETT